VGYHKDKQKPKIAVVPIKQIRTGASPESRPIKTGGSPDLIQESSEQQTPAWQFRGIDEHHADWGWKNLDPAHWRDLLRALRDFEGMTWAAIQAAAGGRARGTNNHYISVTELVTDAQTRLIELGHEELDRVYSLRLTNTVRIYGIREDRTLRLIWRDPHHGTKRACYLTKNVQ
jgi:hypothetical protein